MEDVPFPSFAVYVFIYSYGFVCTIYLCRGNVIHNLDKYVGFTPSWDSLLALGSFRSVSFLPCMCLYASMSIRVPPSKLIFCQENQVSSLTVAVTPAHVCRNLHTNVYHARIYL